MFDLDNIDAVETPENDLEEVVMGLIINSGQARSLAAQPVGGGRIFLSRLNGARGLCLHPPPNSCSQGPPGSAGLN